MKAILRKVQHHNLRTIFSFFYWELAIPTIRLPSRLIFGNTIGFRRNIIPRVSHLLKHFSQEENTQSKQLLDAGFVRTKLINESTKQALIGEYKDAFSKDENLYNHKNGSAYFIEEALVKIPSINKAINEEIDPILRNYFKGEYFISKVSAWRNNHVPHDNPDKDLGLSNAFHNDGFNCRNIQVFILMSNNVTRFTGATKFLSRQDSVSIVRSPFYFSRKFYTNKIKESIYKVCQYFEGSVGDILFLNTSLCLHGASIPKENTHRDIISICVVPSKNAMYT